MMEEKKGSSAKQIGVREVPQEPEEQVHEVGKTLEQVSEEVPQDIKNKIIDIEVEQQEKLRQTMLRNVFQPKTSALQNLTEMF